MEKIILEIQLLCFEKTKINRIWKLEQLSVKLKELADKERKDLQ